MDSIYLRHGDGYVSMTETKYDTESVLQQLIAQHPEFVASDGDGRLLLIRREAAVSVRPDGGDARLSLDHLYLNAEGVPTLVEVKRSSDTRARREVVAQMLDYAANARTSFGEEQIRAWLDAAAREGGGTVDQMLSDRLGVDQPDEFWERVATNLEAERFRLIFVADEIAPELRTIIEFLNGQMGRTEVLAIEVRQYADKAGTHQTIVPRLIGDTANSRVAKRRGGRADKLTRESLLATLTTHGGGEAIAGEHLLRWAERESALSVTWTRAANLVTATAAGKRMIVRLWPYGGVEIQLQNLEWLSPSWTSDDSARLIAELETIEGIEFTPGEARWPKSPLAPLAVDEHFERFRSVLDAAIARVTT